MTQQIGPDAFELSGRRAAPVRAHDHVARQLRDLMERGVLGPGDRLPPERELAVQFGVSRATVRQALSALQSAGLVESLVGKGTFARFDAASVGVSRLVEALRLVQGTLGNQMEVRRLVEPEVARCAATRAAESDLERIRESLAQQEMCVRERRPFLDADSSFHLAIAHATGNPLLVKMIEGIHELLRGSREQSLQTVDGVRQSFDGHRRIATALLARDGAGAYEAMMDHLLDVERLGLEAVVEREPSASADPTG